MVNHIMLNKVPSIDHGNLIGLGDDDHTQYILADGARAFTGNQSFGDFNITNVGDISLDSISDDAGVENTLTVANLNTAFDHSQDNTQAHTDYLLNNADDATTGKLTAAGLETTLTTGLIIPASVTYAFTRSGDADTGLYFNLGLSRYEFHRDGNAGGVIDASDPLAYSFRALVSPALLVPADSYVFVLASALTTGVYFNNATSQIEVKNAGTTKIALKLNGDFISGQGTKHDGHFILTSQEIQTTDATQTAVSSITLLDENTYHIEAFVVGVKSDGSERASYQLAATIYRTGAGNATIQGQTVIHSAESDANWDATFAVSGNLVTVAVTGLAATTIEWGVTYKYINMSN